MFTKVIDEEAGELTQRTATSGELTSADIETTWWRVVRRVVLGDGARDDEAITDTLRRLRSSGNWSFAALPHRRRRDQFSAQLRRYGDQADPQSLMGALLATPTDPQVDAVGQVPQWLFAFDAAGMATIRALAVLATHPDHLAAALEDAEQPDTPKLRPYLRGCMLESVRLWPTTPVLLRDVDPEAGDRGGDGDMEWHAAGGAVRVPRGTGVLITVPAFHRDATLLPFADSFEPAIWTDGRAQQYPQLVPFSAGPVECPGRNLVLFATSTMLAQLLHRLQIELPDKPQLSPHRALPATLDQYSMKFMVRPRQLSESPATQS